MEISSSGCQWQICHWSIVSGRLQWMKWSCLCKWLWNKELTRRIKCGSAEYRCLTLLMSTEETLLNLDFDKPHTTITLPDDGVVSLSSSAEEICLVPDVGFEGNVDSPGVNRESQPLLGGRGDFEVSYNHFPGKYVLLSLTHVYAYFRAKVVNLRSQNIWQGYFSIWRYIR